ncbi:hypothetical protein DT019_08670 [Streptomyces sp. SDr-06]|uniref:RNA polymerase sigma factor n=1 Tax=Streptomyces sp. SDr-06 TaxID=2267702 RepID=UPI000DE8D0AA|nr:sigma factor [Streptomyces sp. SDr-06]RCH68738.1 hypothetical protein DT019_08670 [Streptomyces sp. SDr-06]
MLNMDLIHAAQRNDLDGIKAVLEALEGRIATLARAAANRMKLTGSHFSDHYEDASQEASLALWEALPRFAGETVDSFFAFMYSSMDNRLKDKSRSEMNAGIDKDAIKVFASMLERADGDQHLAEQLAQSVPPKGIRLGADRARAARLAWQGTTSLDSQMSETELPWSDTNLTSPWGVPGDLVTAEDLNGEDRAAKIATVNAVLDSMSDNQANALRLSYGIGGAQCFGTGEAGDLPGLAAALGLGIIPARDARVKGHKTFAKRYIKAVARDDAEAEELTAIAAERLGRGGRK